VTIPVIGMGSKGVDDDEVVVDMGWKKWDLMELIYWLRCQWCEPRWRLTTISGSPMST